MATGPTGIPLPPMGTFGRYDVPRDRRLGKVFVSEEQKRNNQFFSRKNTGTMAGLPYFLLDLLHY